MTYIPQRPDPRFVMYFSEEHQLGYIPIGKNASSWTSKLLRQRLYWDKARPYEGTVIELPVELLSVLVVLRHPVDRYRSGVRQLTVMGRHNLEDVIRHHETKGCLWNGQGDGHLYPQSWVIDAAKAFVVDMKNSEVDRLPLVFYKDPKVWLDEYGVGYEWMANKDQNISETIVAQNIDELVITPEVERWILEYYADDLAYWEALEVPAAAAAVPTAAG